jgi:hypothetical protein
MVTWHVHVCGVLVVLLVAGWVSWGMGLAIYSGKHTKQPAFSNEIATKYQASPIHRHSQIIAWAFVWGAVWTTLPSQT